MVLLVLSVLAGPARGEHYKVFLLAGQSNMSGRAEVGEGMPAELRGPQKDVLIWYEPDDSQKGSAPANGWTALTPFTGGDFGPEVSFGRAVADAMKGDRIALIKYARGGSNLHTDWDAAKGPRFATFVGTVDAALKALREGEPKHTYEIVGMLWLQGESDGKQANVYGDNLRKLMAEVRGRYGAHLPFLIGRINNYHGENDSRVNAVRAEQMRVADADPDAAWIDLDGASKASDGTHYDTAGQLLLGRRFAEAFLRLRSGAASRPTASAPREEGGDSVEVKFKDETDWEIKKTRTLAHLRDFQNVSPPRLSRYGGLLDRPVKATGFFRTEKIDGRWWIIDPDGCLMLSLGVCSTRPPSSPEGQKRIEAKFGSLSSWAQETTNLLWESGFNTLGCWSDWPRLRSTSRPMPYTTQWNFMSSYGKKRGGTRQEPGHTGYPNGCMFVFDPQFEAFCDEHARQASATKDDPYLLGHFSDNELPFTEDLLDRYRQLPDGDPGRRAAEAWWTGRKEATGRIAVTDEDRQAFVEHVAEQYFRTVARAIRKHDPNHMYLGARLHGAAVRIPAVFRACGRHADIVSVNLYRVWTPDGEVTGPWVASANKPFIVTEWYAKGMDSGMKNLSGAGWTVKTQADRGKFYQHFTLSLLQNPGCVGWHWFRYQDNDPDDRQADPSNRDSNKGLVNIAGEPYAPLLTAMRELNRNVYTLIRSFR